ncbi:MAG: M20/M25/M40 family metallo-hydrolase [Candidatus Polarisedimenticolia bacterium]
MRVFLTAGMAWSLIAADSPASEAERAVSLLSELVRIPSESSRTDDVRQAARWLSARLEAAGLRARLLETEPGANPLVFGELPATTGGAPVVLFYMHYDTQPTGPASDWESTGGDPFAARLLSGRWDEPGVSAIEPRTLDNAAEDMWETARLYGRGVADDKAPIVMHLIALEEYARRPVRPLHIKILLDGEEEVGSDHIGIALRQSIDLLRADLLVLCDGPMDALGRPSVYLGTRGDMHARLRLRTAALPAHSGNYGLLPGAVFRMAALLSTMKDPTGRVTIEGFEQDVSPPTAQERAMVAEASKAETVIARELGVMVFEGDAGVPYHERLLFHPTLTVNHLVSGRPGNQVPVLAEAILEVRLVTRQDPRTVFDVLARHVKKHEPAAELEYLDGVAAARMDPADPSVAWGIAAARRALGDDLLVYPTLGGTLPLLAEFEAAGFRYIGLPLVNYDNNQHVGNENLRVTVLPSGIAAVRALYDALGSIRPARRPS